MSGDGLDSLSPRGAEREPARRAASSRSLLAKLRLAFASHPAESGRTYAQHGRTALWLSRRLIGAGIAVAVHAALPFVFTDRASRCVRELHAFFEAMRRVQER